MALSPMMQQYLDTKEKYNDCILFYRLGDFYEMFFEDAKVVSKELELTLTGKSCGLEERAPMCGVPFHSADTYISRLVENGHKVAIAEQLEDPATAKGLVKRDVVKIITPGTITEQSMLSENDNNYLATVFVGKRGIGLAYGDLSTGEIRACEFSGISAKDTLINELVRIHAKEILVNESAEQFLDLAELELSVEGTPEITSDANFGKEAATKTLKMQYQIGSTEAFGLADRAYATSALGALISYLRETQKRDLSHLMPPEVYEIGNHMALDKATIRNLELTETLYEKKRKGSLLGVLDHTSTAMGSRKMKKWLREPLNNTLEINQRLDAVENFVQQPLIRNDITESLKQVYDFERLVGRISYGNANAKDLIALKRSLFVLPEIKMSMLDCDASLLKQLGEAIHPLPQVYEAIDLAITEDPPFTIKEGGLIKEGFSEELDDLKDSIKDAKAWIAGLEATERERTGIGSLKVGYNKVFGYYIEVTKTNTDMVPEDYVRKQTLTNAERYIIPELKEKESLVLNAETRIHQTEYRIFTDLRDEIRHYIREIQETSQCISDLDVLTAYADVSDKLGYVKPTINDGDQIIIEKGRHPVIERTVEDHVFVSNDTYMNRDDTSLLLITGPNMSGKSTYMRQTALIVLMAQTGCFVPAESAVIGTVDRIFTRIGASDNLAGGQSTFYVEMSELAYILNTATERSLVILDEIGRGTSTYDGLSIAWAVVEYLCDPERRVRTMFASHYHELTNMQQHGLKNLNVDVAEENGDVIFLHKIVEGSASRSYGIHVAKLAGVPKPILERAGEKLEQLEDASDEMTTSGHQLQMF